MHFFSKQLYSVELNHRWSTAYAEDWLTVLRSCERLSLSAHDSYIINDTHRPQPQTLSVASSSWSAFQQTSKKCAMSQGALRENLSCWEVPGSHCAAWLPTSTHKYVPPGSATATATDVEAAAAVMAVELDMAAGNALTILTLEVEARAQCTQVDSFLRPAHEKAQNCWPSYFVCLRRQSFFMERSKISS